MLEGRELGLLAGIGETEATANLAVAGHEGRFDPQADAGITLHPVGFEILDQRDIARGQEDFEIFPFGQQFGERFLAELGNHFRRRLVAGEQTPCDVKGEGRQRLPQLIHHDGFNSSQLRQRPVTQHLHVRPELHHLLVAQGAGGIDPAVVAVLRDLPELGLGTKAAALARDGRGGERAVEGDEFGKGHGQLTSPWAESDSRVICPSSSSRRTA